MACLVGQNDLVPVSAQRGMASSPGAGWRRWGTVPPRFAIGSGVGPQGLDLRKGLIVTELQEERLEETEVDLVWSGKPVTLTRGGDAYLYGRLLSTIHLPAEHVPPVSRQAAEHILEAEADRRELDEFLDARVGQRAELVEKLSEAEDQQAAAQQLANFDAVSELRRALIPKRDAAIWSAWEAFNAALDADAAEWDNYLLAQGRRAATEALELLTPGLAKLRECQLIDALKAREGIFHLTDSATNFDRSQRRLSIDRIDHGADLGTEGTQHGLLELAHTFKAVFAQPTTTIADLEAELEEVEPYAVRVRKAALGLGPDPGRQTH